MATADTVHLRQDWADAQRQKCGGIAAFAQKCGVDKGTASRQMRRKAESGPRFIAAVLQKFDTTFDDAFEVVIDDIAPE